VIERFAIEKIAFFTTSTGVAHHSGRSTSEHDWTMASQLKTAQHDLAKKVARMQ
jgi:hypothetical protein